MGTPTVDDAHKFAGMYLDGESGLYYTWQRMYDPTLGRWLAPDPIAGDASDPNSLNRYQCVLNNPVNPIDPLGLLTPVPPPPLPEPPTGFDLPPGCIWITTDTFYGLLCDPSTYGNGGQRPPAPTGNKAPLSPGDQKTYDKNKAKALDGLMNPDCLTYLILKGIDPTMLQVGILYQQPYNGNRSTITMQDAGLFGIALVHRIPPVGRGDTIYPGFPKPQASRDIYRM